MTKNKIILALLICSVVLGIMAKAEPQVYRQIKDVSVRENGSVGQSEQKDNLFEYTFELNPERTTITRTKVLRLDKPAATDDKTTYTVVQKRELVGSESGNGGKVLIAVRKDGSEILELGHRFAFTMRTSQFSQVITGVYQRIYDKDHPRRHRQQDQKPAPKP